MLYIFTIKESVLGICDEDHLKENVEKIWNESRENGEENDVVVYCVEKINSVGYEEAITSYYFDKYDEGTKLGLRLIGLGGAIDIPLEIEAQTAVIRAQIEAFGKGIHYARYVFYQRVAPNIHSILSGDQQQGLGALFMPLLPEVNKEEVR